MLNSRHAPDAHQRTAYLREHLTARHEIGVGLRYPNRNASWVAANCGQQVSVHCPQSICGSNALALMAESCTRLRDTRLADDAKRVLQQNDPDRSVAERASVEQSRRA